jgi:sugar lactone lactonase YvrE
MKIRTRVIYSAFVVVILALWPLAANGAPGGLFASVNRIAANGEGAIYQYTPGGVQTIFTSGLSQPRGVGFDSVGNLFVATNVCVGARCEVTRPLVLKVTPDGTQNVFTTMPSSFVAEGVAIDRSDNVFVLVFEPFNLSVIYKFTPDGLGRPFGFLSHPKTEGFALAFDSAGNLFAADAVGGTIYKFAPDGTQSIFVGPEAFGELGEPIGLAFDHFDNLFVSLFNGVDFAGVLKFTPSGVRTIFATGLDNPRGLAFDSAGNLFVAEIPFPGSGDILKFTPEGTRTVFASGIGDPQGNSGPEFLTFQPALPP